MRSGRDDAGLQLDKCWTVSIGSRRVVAGGRTNLRYADGRTIQFSLGGWLTARILHVCNWYVPGLGYEENCLPAEQAKLGNDVAVLTSDRVPQLLMETSHFKKLYPRGKVGPKVSTDQNVRIFRQRSTPEASGQTLLLRMAGRIKELDPEVVHCHGATNPSSVGCVLLQPRMKYVLFVDD